MEKIVPLLVLLFLVMTITGVMKETNSVPSVYYVLKKYVKSKRALVAIVSLVFGILPVQGRIGLVCGMLDAVQDKGKNSGVQAPGARPEAFKP